MKKDEFICKLLILGNAYVGKTSLLKRYTKGKWDEKAVATLGKYFFK